MRPVEAFEEVVERPALAAAGLAGGRRQGEFGAPDGLEVLGQLRHVPLEHPERQGGRVDAEGRGQAKPAPAHFRKRVFERGEPVVGRTAALPEGLDPCAQRVDAFAEGRDMCSRQRIQRGSENLGDACVDPRHRRRSACAGARHGAGCAQAAAPEAERLLADLGEFEAAAAQRGQRQLAESGIAGALGECGEQSVALDPAFAEPFAGGGKEGPLQDASLQPRHRACRSGRTDRLRHLARDLFGVEVEEPDAAVDQFGLRRHREAVPDRGRRRQPAAHDERAPGPDLRQRCDIPAGVGSDQHVDRQRPRVDAQRSVGEGEHDSCRRRARAQQGPALDAGAGFLRQRLRQAAGDGARLVRRAGVDAQAEHTRCRGFRIGRERQCAAIAGCFSAAAGEDEASVLCLRRQHVVDRGDDGARQAPAELGPAVPREQRGQVLPAIRRVARMWQRSRSRPVFEALAEAGADFAHQRSVLGERLLAALEHGHAALALQQGSDELAGEGTEHRHIDDADAQPARAAQMVGDGFGGAGEAAHGDDQVLGVAGEVAADAAVAATGQAFVLVHARVGDGRDVLEEVGPLRRRRLHVRVLVLDDARNQRGIDVPGARDAPPALTEEHRLRHRRRVDLIVGTAQEIGDQSRFRKAQRFDRLRRRRRVVPDQRRRQRQFGNPVCDQVEIGDFLDVARQQLDDAGVGDAVIVVVSIAGMRSHAPATDVQHVGQALAGRGVERFVQEGDAAAGGERTRAQSRQGEAGEHPGGGVFAFRMQDLRLTRGDRELPAASGRTGCRGAFHHGIAGCAGDPLAHRVAVGDLGDSGIAECRGRRLGHRLGDEQRTKGFQKHEDSGKSFRESAGGVARGTARESAPQAASAPLPAAAAFFFFCASALAGR